MASYEPYGAEVTELIDRIIRNSPISVSMADPLLPQAPIIGVSYAFEVLTGFKRQDVMGKSLRFAMETRGADPQVHRSMELVCTDGSATATFAGKVDLRRKDGSILKVFLRLQSVFYGGRRIVVAIHSNAKDGSFPQQHIAELGKAVTDRGMLAKWMWSETPTARQELGQKEGNHVVQRISVVTQPRKLTPDHNIEDSLVILVSYRIGPAIIAAMGEGACNAKVCPTMAEAKTAASSFRRESRFVCGELDYEAPRGFDFSLCPADFIGSMGHHPSLVLSGLCLPLAVTWAQRAKILVLGSFLNVSALIELIVQLQPMPVILCCAGQDRTENPQVEQEIFCAYLLHTLLATVEQPALLLFSDTARQVMQKIDSENPRISAQYETRNSPRTRELLTERPHLASAIDFTLDVDRYAMTLPWYSNFLSLFIHRRSPNRLGLPKHSLSAPILDPNGGIQDKSPADEVAGPFTGRTTVRLYLVRHGEYEGEMVQGMAGLLDPRLTDRGLAAARRVSDMLAAEPVEVLLFSPLARSMQTAEMVARPHKKRCLVSEINSSLTAVNRGDWSGLTPQQVEEHFPGDLKAWRDNHDFREHGGESFRELMERTRKALSHVLEIADGKMRKGTGDPICACLVGHSSTVASFVTMARPGPPNADQWTSISKRINYCSVTLVEFEYTPDGGRRSRVVYIGKTPDAVYDEPVAGPTKTANTVVPGLVQTSENSLLRAMSVRQGGRLLTDASLDPSRQSGVPVFSSVSVVTLPSDISPAHHIDDRLVVLIDALRMSSTLVTAMGQGLGAAQLFSTVMEVIHAVRDYGSEALLGGEQKRVLIPGFDRDNSPLSYLDGVTERTALFLTTNGTRALPWIRRSKMLVLGSFLNVSAVVRTILAHLKDVSGVVFVCAGTERGTVRSEDDELCAGYLLKTLLASHKSPHMLTLDEVAVSVLQKLYALDSWEDICEAFNATPAADELKKIQLAPDIEFCLQRDRYRDTLPFYFSAQDMFIPHQVQYDIPVHYGASWMARPVRGPRRGDTELIQVYLIWQDEESDVFEIIARESVMGVGEVEEARRHSELIHGFDWTEVAQVATSPSHKCRVTAEHIGKCRGLTEVYSGLGTVRSGDWQGLSATEIEVHYPGAVEMWHQRPDWKEHGGESFREVHTRATSTFNNLLASYINRGYTGALVIVTHSALVRSILMATQHVSPDSISHTQDIVVPMIRNSVILVDVYVPVEDEEDWEQVQRKIPEGCEFRVTNVGRGSVPVALASRVSRL